MKSAVRQRNRPPATADDSRPARRVSWHEDVLKKQNKTVSDDLYLSWHFVLLYVALVAGMTSVSMHFLWRLPEVQRPDSAGQPNQFHALRARTHMEDLVALGIRHVGSEANEVHAKNLIVSKIESIKAMASDKVDIEISVQHPSGTFYVDFLGGLNHIYQNVTNVVVRLSRKAPDTRQHAFLVNAHYDSAIGSYSASDDAVSCGTMLEALRALSSEPDPLLADNALIFLFNGAEETLLQASHGFITQHPWAKSIRAFLNLEAAGAGGKEIVFQTGPDHPWLAKLYSESVPHPHASVMAQEVFQSGVIPSDTDFRIFRDFGHIPGIDTAYFINGYVYHTEYDVPSAVPDGSIQRAGENVLALLRAVVRSPHLSNPIAQDLQTKVVFFDILGLLAVVYPEAVAVAMNFVCALLFAVTFVRDVNWSGAAESDKPSLKLVFLSSVVMFSSWLGALLVAVAVAILLTVLGQPMSWYSEPVLIIPLYVLPAFLAVGDIHTQLIKRTSYSQSQLEKSSLLSIQFFWSAMLLLLTCLHIMSAYILFVTISFQLLFRSFLHDTLISPEMKKTRFYGARALAYVLCSAFATGLPLMLRVQLDVGMMLFFVPIMGRVGALIPSDVLIALITVVIVVTNTPYMVSVVIYSSTRQFKRWVGVLLLGVVLLAIVVVGMGYVPPYSVKDKAFPKPKRLLLTHTDRTFYGRDGSIVSQDSHVFMYPSDYLEMRPIQAASPLFRDAKTMECKGMQCSEPIFIPLRHIITSWSIPSSPLSDREGASIKLISSKMTSDTSRNMTFQAHFPLRCTGNIGTGEGVALKSWSLEKFIPPANSCPGSHADKGCYFIFHARGFGDGDFTFWIEIEGDTDAQEVLRIAISAHYLDPPQSHTPDLNSLINDLPEWVTVVGWAAIYREWIF